MPLDYRRAVDRLEHQSRCCDNLPHLCTFVSCERHAYSHARSCSFVRSSSLITNGGHRYGEKEQAAGVDAGGTIEHGESVGAYLQRRAVDRHRQRLDLSGQHLRRRAPRRGGAPALCRSAKDLVDDQRSGRHRLVRRVGHGRRRRALPDGEGQQAAQEPAVVAALRMDGVEGDRRVHRARRHLPRGSRHIS